MQFINQDCFALSTAPRFAPYDIYMYDGGHSQEDHRKAVVDMWPLLPDVCIFLVDDWEWEQVKVGTREGLVAVGASVVASWELPGKNNSPEGRRGFWNGCGIFVLQK
jgi:hypothetical protein